MTTYGFSGNRDGYRVGTAIIPRSWQGGYAVSLLISGPYHGQEMQGGRLGVWAVVKSGDWKRDSSERKRGRTDECTSLIYRYLEDDVNHQG
jgi:hypothetical protein